MASCFDSLDWQICTSSQRPPQNAVLEIFLTRIIAWYRATGLSNHKSCAVVQSLFLQSVTHQTMKHIVCCLVRSSETHQTELRVSTQGRALFGYVQPSNESKLKFKKLNLLQNSQIQQNQYDYSPFKKDDDLMKG